jgi:hypothetical protein
LRAAGVLHGMDQLKAGQGVLTDKLTKAQTFVKTVLFPAETKLQTLITAIQNPAVFAGPFTINDLLNKDKNDQQEVFTLNAVNYLTDPVKIFIASAATDPVQPDACGFDRRNGANEDGCDASDRAVCDSTGDGGNRGRPCAVPAI